MANVFTNATATIANTTPVDVYTATGVTTVVIGCTVANTTTTQINADVKCAGKYLVKNLPIPAGSSISVLDGKIILTDTQTVNVTSSSATGDLDVIVSVLEQS